MRAIIYSQKGPSEVLRLVDRPVPEPGPGQVRVRMHRAGVNPTDWKMRADTGAPLEFGEVTPGQDGAGVIDSVGGGVEGPSTGDRVWIYLGQYGLPYGTAAEFSIVAADRVVPLPETFPDSDATFDLGASLGVPAITAHRALTCGTRNQRLGPGTMNGQVVLVHGGAGAVGNAAIQLAAWSGATVITTVSSEDKAEQATRAGAQHAVNYRAGDTAAAIGKVAPDGVDLIAEVAPAQNNELDLDVLRTGGTIAIYANSGGASFPVEIRRTFRLNPRYQFIFLYTVAPELLAAAAQDVSAAVANGALRVGEHAGLRLHHYRLEETAVAHDAVEAGAVGKVLIDIS